MMGDIVETAKRSARLRIDVAGQASVLRIDSSPHTSQARTLPVGGRPSTRTRRISDAACTAMAVCA